MSGLGVVVTRLWTTTCNGRARGSRSSMTIHQEPIDPQQLARWGELRDAGLSAHQVRALLRAGRLHRVGYGMYATDVELPDAESWRLLSMDHLRRARTMALTFPGHIISHQTAAVLHGLPLILHPDMDVHLTSADRAPRSRRRDRTQLHHADSIENESVVVDGLHVTTVARTVADVLRTSTPRHSVPVFDAAVRLGLTTADEVNLTLASQKRWLGMPRAKGAFELHDQRRESWLESYSFVRLVELGLPIPRAQVDVLDEGYHFVARVDGLIGTTVLEADGADKYLIPSREQGMTEEESVRVSLERQADRQSRLEALGLTCVRWTTTEIRHEAEAVVSRITRARENSRRPFTGWFRYDGRIIRPE